MTESALQRIKRRNSERRARQVRVNHPDDPTITLLCNVPTDGEKLDALTTAAEKLDRGRASGVHFARWLLADCVEAIEELGEPIAVAGITGAANFRDPELWAELGVANKRDAVREFFGGDDAAIGQLAKALMDEAGWSPEAAGMVDPTPA